MFKRGIDILILSFNYLKSFVYVCGFFKLAYEFYNHIKLLVYEVYEVYEENNHIIPLHFYSMQKIVFQKPIIFFI